MIAGAAFALWFGNTSVSAMATLSLLLSLIAQAGDLGRIGNKAVFWREGLSGLIPGHGGVLDRFDGLVFAAMGAGLVAAIADP